MDDKPSEENLPQSLSLKVADDAVPLCPNCMEPCDPSNHYCPNCDSNEAMNPLTPYLPFEGIRFTAGVYAKLWRQMWGGDVSTGFRILQIGIFIFFFPFIFLIGLPFVIMEKLKSRNNISIQDIE